MKLLNPRRSACSMVIVSLILLLLSQTGCVFPTKILTSADSPETVLEQFVSAMKAKDYERADSFLAGGASVSMASDNDDILFNGYIDVALRRLECRPVNDTAYNGTDAVINRVSVTRTNNHNFIPWVKANMAIYEHEYISRHHITEFDRTDRTAVSEMLSMALRDYEKTAGFKTVVVSVSFVYDDSRWKLTEPYELMEAIFGGVSD